MAQPDQQIGMLAAAAAADTSDRPAAGPRLTRHLAHKLGATEEHEPHRTPPLHPSLHLYSTALALFFVSVVHFVLLHAIA